MHPTIQAEVAKARAADQQRQANRVAIARAAGKARGSLLPHGPVQAAGLAWRILAVLAARRRPAPARPTQLPACQPLAGCNTCS
jgi:hypothetical protein